MQPSAPPDIGDVIIRRMSHDDLDEALALSSAAGWNQRVEEWRLLLDIAPARSFAASAGNRIVGTAIGIDYGTFSWIAMMLVEPAFRGRGLGSRLLQSALDAVPAHTPVRLDATPAGRPLYRAHGFEDETVLTRWVAEMPRPAPGDAVGGGTGYAVCTLTARDLDDVAACDEPVFGGNRSVVLHWALDSAPQYAHGIARREANGRDQAAGGRSAGKPVLQYCFGRYGRLFDQIGPVVASNEDAACALVYAALEGAHDRAVAVDAFDAHIRFTSWLQACGFQAQRPLFRMRRPPRDDSVGPEFGRAIAPDVSPANAREIRDAATRLRQFAIAGPELA